MKIATVIDHSPDGTLIVGVFTEHKVASAVDDYAQRLKDNSDDIVLESKAIDAEANNEQRTVYTYVRDGHDDPSIFISVNWSMLNEMAAEPAMIA